MKKVRVTLKKMGSVIAGMMFSTLALAQQVDVPTPDRVGMNDSGNLMNDIVAYVVLAIGIILALLGAKIVFASIDGAVAALANAKDGRGEVSDAAKPIATGLILIVVMVAMGWFVLDMFSSYSS